MQKVKEYFKTNWIILLNLLIYPLILFIPIYYQSVYIEQTLELQNYVNFYQFLSFVNPIYTTFSIFLIIGFVVYFFYILILFLKNNNYYKLYKFKRQTNNLLLIVNFSLLIISFILLIISIVFVSTSQQTGEILTHNYFFNLGTPTLFIYSLINIIITNSFLKRKKL